MRPRRDQEPVLPWQCALLFSRVPQAIHYGRNFVSLPNYELFFSQLKQYFDDNLIFVSLANFTLKKQ